MVTPLETLECSMTPNTAEATTIREYLIALLTAIWSKQEGFSGKRPFGNSDWDSDLIESLVRHQLIEGTIDEDGYLDDADWDEGNRLIMEAITELGRRPPSPVRDAEEDLAAKREALNRASWAVTDAEKALSAALAAGQ